MEALNLLRDLFRHMEWADAIVWRAVFAAPAATADRVIRERLYHLHLVQRAFLLIWNHQPITFAGTEALTPEQLANWAFEYHRNVGGFLVTLSPASLDTEVQLPWTSHITALPNPQKPSLGETLTQVTAHSTYHRGQVNARLREVGAEPPLTDFIAWVWHGKPEPSWPSPVPPTPA